MTPDQIKAVVDEVFAVLETTVMSRPLLYMAVQFAHRLIDDVVLAKVAAKLNAPK